MPHKRIDVAVRAFNRLGLPLIVVGNGPDARRLRRLAGPTVALHRPRRATPRSPALLARARALVVTATEEFGIAAVEAQAAGRPVIALREGGARETVVEGVTGTFFDEPDARRARRGGPRASTPLAVDPRACVRNARALRRRRASAAGCATVVDEALAGERAPREERRRRVPRGLALAS